MYLSVKQQTTVINSGNGIWSVIQLHVFTIFVFIRNMYIS